jgi:hypothetical protein
VSIVYMPVVFVAGLVLHSTCVVLNMWERR